MIYLTGEKAAALSTPWLCRSLDSGVLGTHLPPAPTLTAAGQERIFIQWDMPGNEPYAVIHRLGSPPGMAYRTLYCVCASQVTFKTCSSSQGWPPNMESGSLWHLFAPHVSPGAHLLHLPTETHSYQRRPCTATLTPKTRKELASFQPGAPSANWPTRL